MIATEEIGLNRYQALLDIIRISGDDVISPLQKELIQLARERKRRLAITDEQIVKRATSSEILPLYLMQDGSVSLSKTGGKYLMDVRLKFSMEAQIAATGSFNILSVSIELSNPEYNSRLDYPLTFIDVRNNTPVSHRNCIKTPLVNILERIAWEIERRNRD